MSSGDGDDTAAGSTAAASASAAAIPGVVQIFGPGGVEHVATPLRRGRLVYGRRSGSGIVIDDDRLSRDHVEVRRDHQGWNVTDLGSRNGTHVEGARITGSVAAHGGALVRIGRALLMLWDDIRPWDSWRAPADGSGRVVGPRSVPILEAVERAARNGQPILVGGETGTGKELAIAAYQAATQRRGKFVAVNCAAIPVSLAEGMLFGSRRGAYSGAVDAEGLIAAADGGVLFLDEVAELDLGVQAKLLRALETREVLALGATTPRAVDLRLCAATHRDLEASIRTGEFRADLYYRIARARVQLLALRERREEIPLLVAAALARASSSLVAHEKLVEHCCLQPWRGNVRDLLGAIECAVVNAREGGSDIVRLEHLPNAAPADTPAPGDADSPAAANAMELDLAALRQAIDAHGGNLAATARGLGLHRTQLYRLLERHGLAPRRD